MRAMLHMKGGRPYRNGKPRRGDGEQLQPGDIVVLLGPIVQLERARLLNHGFGEGREIEVRSFSLTPLPGARHAFDTVIICGLGKIGYNVVRALALLRPQPRVVRPVR